MFQILYSQDNRPGLVGFADAGSACGWLMDHAQALDWFKWVRQPALPLYH